MKTAVHFSRKSDEWTTPPDLFEELDKDFRFGLDAAASKENALCPRFFTIEDNALIQNWFGYGTIFVNPPYSRVGEFLEKAYLESIRGVTSVFLVPSRTDTKWWHRWARRGLIIHLKGRLKFGGSPNSAPFPSAIVIFWGGRLGEAVRPS